MNLFFCALPLLLLLACNTMDPGEAVNHVHVGKYIIDLTFGPIFSVVCSAIIAPIIVKLIGRKIAKSDAEKIAAIKKLEDARTQANAAKEKLDAERHGAVITKINGICDRFDKVDRRFYNHGHGIEERGGKLHTTDIIIKQGIDGV